MPETVALLGAMSGTPRLMAALIYGGGLRVSECCELRIKDVEFDQGLVFVRRGRGDKDRSTLLAEVGREELGAVTRREAAQQVKIATRRRPSRYVNGTLSQIETETMGRVSSG